MSRRSRRPRLWIFLTILLGLEAFFAISGCRRPSQLYPPVEATDGIQEIAETWQKGANRKKGRQLIELFWDVCLLRCHGFEFEPAGTLAGGQVARYVWAHRDRAGSLPNDLVGHLASYRFVRRSRAEITALRRRGRRTAEVELSLEVDGILKTGHRRSDRGTIRLRLERRGLSTPWRVTGFRADQMETLVSAGPGFSRLEPLPRSFARPKRGRRAWPPPIAPVAAGDLDGDGRGDLVVGRGRSLTIWKQGPGASFRRTQRLRASQAVCGPLLFADTNGDNTVDLFFRSRAGVSYLSRRSPQTSRLEKPRPLRKELRTAAATFVDAGADGRLDLCAVGEHRSAKRDAQRTSQRGGFLLSPSFEARRPLRPLFRSPASARRLRLVGSPSHPRIVSVAAKGVYVSELAGQKREKTSRLARRWASDCAVARMGRRQREQIAVFAASNPWRWTYRQPDFPRPFEALTSSVSWGKRLQAASAGSLLLNARSPNEARPLAPSSSGWDTAGTAVDIDGDGRQELAVLQVATKPRSAGCWSFWIDHFASWWRSDRLVARHATECAAPSTRLRLLERNRAGGLSDLGWVLGLQPQGSHQSVLAFDLAGNGARDLVVASDTGHVEIFRNELPQRGVVKLEIVGPPQNRSSVGAEIRATIDLAGKKREIIRRVTASPGDAAPHSVAIGLGTYEPVSVKVEWPGGRTATATVRAGEPAQITYPQ
jgi:hypothetical protein